MIWMISSLDCHVISKKHGLGTIVHHKKSNTASNDMLASLFTTTHCPKFSVKEIKNLKSTTHNQPWDARHDKQNHVDAIGCCVNSLSKTPRQQIFIKTKA